MDHGIFRTNVASELVLERAMGILKTIKCGKQFRRGKKNISNCIGEENWNSKRENCHQ